ncbi:MAG: ankyrin repeat domain-containing protein [Chloroherpetonaceae bacterium]|nr:ankyrin repeat domain-containing protein [Chthonomonadaceae bacterium]MDW8207101.1 ankyrin repeat domain-containing protein [Chloroherpetonaceae bacterium]
MFLRILLALIILPVLWTGCRPRPDDRTFLDAVLRGDTTAVQHMLNAGANIEARNDSGRTALALAALKSNETMVLLLLDRGANVNARDPAGMTPLMWAAFGGNPRIVQALLDRGADVHARDAQGGTARTWAQRPEIAQLLQKAGAPR